MNATYVALMLSFAALIILSARLRNLERRFELERRHNTEQIREILRILAKMNGTSVDEILKRHE